MVCNTFCHASFWERTSYLNTSKYLPLQQVHVSITVSLSNVCDRSCRRRVLIVARAIGRFEIKQVVSDKPFVTAMVRDMADMTPETFQQAADISTAATQLWQCMQQVKDLAGKLYNHAGPISESHTMCTPAAPIAQLSCKGGVQAASHVPTTSPHQDTP